METETKFKRTTLSYNQLAREAIENPYLIRRHLIENPKKGESSLFEFLKYFWEEVSTDKFKPNWHISKVLCPELEKVANRVAENKPKLHDLIINIPPGTTKTITCSIMFPAWCWTKWPWMRFITAAYSSSLALESAEYSRDLIRSEKFKELYPELAIKDDKDTKSNFKVVKKKQAPGFAARIQHGGNRYSTSVGGTLTGYHGHILIVDDPLNPKQAVSEKELENALHWMDHTLPTRKTDKANSATVLVMQRLHQNDPTGHILSKKKKNVHHISLPGEIENYRDQVKPDSLIKYYSKDGLLDTRRMSWSVLADLELDMGQYGYAGQVGQKPTPAGGGMFKEDHLQMLHNLPSPVNFIQTVRYWDKAGSEGKGAFTVGVKMARLQNDTYLVMDVKRGQWSSEQRENIIRQTAEADGRVVEIGIEQEPGSGGKESAEATIRRLAGFSCFLERPTGDKAFRADPFSVQVNNGNVKIMVGDWNNKYTDELSNFPFSTYADQVDASSGAFNRLVRKKIARRIT